MAIKLTIEGVPVAVSRPTDDTMSYSFHVYEEGRSEWVFAAHVPADIVETLCLRHGSIEEGLLAVCRIILGTEPDPPSPGGPGSHRNADLVNLAGVDDVLDWDVFLVSVIRRYIHSLPRSYTDWSVCHSFKSPKISVEDREPVKDDRSWVRINVLQQYND